MQGRAVLAGCPCVRAALQTQLHMRTKLVAPRPPGGDMGHTQQGNKVHAILRGLRQPALILSRGRRAPGARSARPARRAPRARCAAPPAPPAAPPAGGARSAPGLGVPAWAHVTSAPGQLPTQTEAGKSSPTLYVRFPAGKRRVRLGAAPPVRSRRRRARLRPPRPPCAGARPPRPPPAPCTHSKPPIAPEKAQRAAVMVLLISIHTARWDTF